MREKPRGILFVLLSAICFSMMTFSVRSLDGRLRPDFIVLVRFFGQAVLMLPFLGAKRSLFSDWPRIRFHFLRGFLGVAAVFLLYISVERLPLAMATLLLLTSTFWSWLFASIFLKERLNYRQTILGGLTVLGLAGSVSASGMTANWHWDWWGGICGLVAGMFSGAAVTVLRRMRQTLPTAEIVFFFGLCGVACMLPGVIISPPAIPPGVGGWLAAAAILATVAQVAMSAGFRETKAAIGSLCLLLQIPLTVIIGSVYLGETPPPLFMAGSLITVLGLAGLVMEGKSVKGGPAE